MALDHDVILVENFRESLDLYQRSLVWAMTASSAFFVLTLSLGDSRFPSVSVLYGQLSGPAAWFVALGLFFVLGILAGSALQSAEAALARLKVESKMTAAVLLYPSLATNSNGFVRVGTVLFSPIVVLIAFGLELWREWDGTIERDVWWWFGLLLFVVLIAAPYVGIASRVWRQLGAESNKAGKSVMRRTWTIIAVRDVFVSLKWYQALLGLTQKPPEHDYFGQVLDADGTVLLCLHKWGDHEHPTLSSPENGKPGNGLLLFLRVDDFDATLARARTLGLSFEEEPHVNPGTKTLEFSVRDPDGYFVSISALAAA